MAGNAQVTIVLPGSGIWELEDRDGGPTEVFARGDRAEFRAVRWLLEASAPPDSVALEAFWAARGLAMMGWGGAEGPLRVRDAVRRAIVCLMLTGMHLSQATSLFLTFRGASTLGSHEVAATAEMRRRATRGLVPVTVGTVVDEAMGDAVDAVLVATGAGETTSVAGRSHSLAAGLPE